MTRTPKPQSVRLAAIAVTLGAGLALSGCGFDAQTLQSYTPAQGVNTDVQTVKVRNLVIIANEAGRGRVSASIVSADKADALTSVAGNAHKPDGSEAAALTVTGGSVALPANKLVVLTGDGAPALGVAASGLRPGLTADLTLQFSSGAQAKLTVPVVSHTDPHYAAAAPELAG